MSDHKPITELLSGDAGGLDQSGAVKQAYKGPVLTKFGSVRDLTGGNNSGITPDDISMTMAP